MAILKIRTYPETVLRTPAKPVTEITPSLISLASDMLETMYAAPGVGLAAPQIGLSIRLCVIDTRTSENMTDLEKAVTYPLKLFNPLITKKEGKAKYDEGCLSVPGYIEDAGRAEYVEFEALNEENKKIKIKTDGLLAICIQHEIDHLDGKLFIDRLSTVKRSLIKARIKKHGFSKNSEDDRED